MATQYGGNGDDTLTGTDQADTLHGGAGADSITGGAGSDQIFGNDGLDSPDGGDIIDAGDGADTVQGDGGNDTVWGGAGNDSLFGGSGDDWLNGGADNDVLYGGVGSDTLIGGDGDDLIYASDGNDLLVGGAGNDTLYGHAGADTFVIASGSGIDTIEDYSAADGDVLLVDYPGITSFTDLQPYLSDDGNYGTLISFPDGSVTQVKWLNIATVSASDFAFQSGTICFARGTLIDTETGPRPVEALRPGDRIVTLDNGLQPLRYLGRRTYRFAPGPHRMKPIRLRPGTLGPGYPARELLVSPQHRIGVPAAQPERIVAARKLLALRGVTTRPSCRLARYYHLLLDRHELVRANGLWAESLLLTGYARARIGPACPASIGRMTPVRPIARGLSTGG